MKANQEEMLCSEHLQSFSRSARDELLPLLTSFYKKPVQKKKFCIFQCKTHGTRADSAASPGCALSLPISGVPEEDSLHGASASQSLLFAITEFSIKTAAVFHPRAEPFP